MLPPNVQPNWYDNDTDTQAMLMGYETIRQKEEVEMLIGGLGCFR